jgi:hypothetical protein
VFTQKVFFIGYKFLFANAKLFFRRTWIAVSQTDIEVAKDTVPKVCLGEAAKKEMRKRQGF